MPFLSTSGERVFYAARGKSGPPVLLLHGAGGSHLAWNAQLAGLAGSARVYGVDLPGHGRSTGAGRASVRAYAEFVCAFLDALGLASVFLAGHSMGGAIAQTLALDFPSRVAGLGLVGTGSRLRVLPAFLEGICSDFASAAHAITEMEFAPDADPCLKTHNEQELFKISPHVLHDDFAACDAFDIIERIPAITTPTVVICGTADHMTPLKYSQYLAAHIPGARLYPVEAAGHMVMVEKPDQVSAILLNAFAS